MSTLITIVIQRSTTSYTLTKKFDINVDTLKAVKEEYRDKHDNTVDITQLDLRGALNGKTRVYGPDDATLATIGVKKRIPPLVLKLSSRVAGGAAPKLSSNDNILNITRDRKIDKTDPEIKISKKPDCVYFDDSEDRAEMPCGHAFTAYSMYNALKSVLTKNSYEYEIKCPACNQLFDFDLCSKVADLSYDEYIYFISELQKRECPEMKPCPHCKIDCERPESLHKFRVNCRACKKSDWCFLCGKVWTGSGFTVCGNKDCPSYEINIDLAECPLKETTYGSGGKKVQVPELRACPNCTHFIVHSDRCKHMKCPQCGHNFCFSCLKPQINGSWQCDSVSFQCPIATRQKF